MTQASNVKFPEPVGKFTRRPPSKPWGRESVGIYGGVGHWPGLTEEAVTEYKAEYQEYMDAAESYNKEMRNFYELFLGAMQTYGISSQVNMDIKGCTSKKSVRLKSYLAVAYPQASVCNPYLYDEEAFLKDEKALASKIVADKEQAEFHTKAVQYLLDKGKKLGEDFLIPDAIAAANDVAYEIEVVMQKSSDETHQFSGNNCDDCPGWDGESHRCSCGNRRVSWVTGWNHSFLSPSVEAEAH